MKTPEMIVEEYAPSVACVEVADVATGERGIGTAFHVGTGIFVTARHVVENKRIISISTTVPTREAEANGWMRVRHKARSTTAFEVFPHPDPLVDVACLKTDLQASHVRLGLYDDGVIGALGYMLRPVVVMGYPRIACIEPALVCTRGEINAVVRPYVGSRHPHFLISQMARGGFSGGPAILSETGECLGVVTQAFVEDGQPEEQGFFAVLTGQTILETLREHALLPEEQPDARMLYDLLDLVEQDRREEAGELPKRPRTTTYYIRGIRLAGQSTLVEVAETHEEAIARANAIAETKASGPYSMLRVFASDQADPIHSVQIPDAGRPVHPRREPE